MRTWLTIAALLAIGVPSAAAADPLRAGAEAVRDRALNDPPPTITSSPSRSRWASGWPAPRRRPRARDWGVAKLTSLGFAERPRRAVPDHRLGRAARGRRDRRALPQKLAILGLGGSVPTPPGGHRGGDRAVPQLRRAAGRAARLAGRQDRRGHPADGPRPDDRLGYGVLQPVRRQGPSRGGQARRGRLSGALDRHRRQPRCRTPAAPNYEPTRRRSPPRRSRPSTPS